jgi:hypothetical protein
MPRRSNRKATGTSDADATPPERGDGAQAELPAVAEAADRLYATEPEGFVVVRDELAKQARAAGDDAVAKRIGGLRKPTVAAFVVNHYVLAQPETVAQLLDLNHRLQDAQTALDAAVLRQLTEERRTVVGELASAALAGAGRADAPTGLRDEVVATLDAAVADPDVAGRLGRLLRAEHWSGFGVAAGDVAPDAPALRLVRGGGGGRAPARRRAAGTAAAPEQPAEKPAKQAGKRVTAPDRRAQRTLRDATKAFEAAETELDDAQTAERTTRDRVRELTDELARVQARLDDAKADHERARRAAKTAHTRRRETRAALDRAERNAAT